MCDEISVYGFYQTLFVNVEISIPLIKSDFVLGMFERKI